MKIEATRDFRDLKEGVARKKGDIFDVTKERFEEINSTKYGVLAVLVETEEIEEEEVSLEKLTVAQLKELLDGKEVEYNSKAKKEELIALLRAGE